MEPFKNFDTEFNRSEKQYSEIVSFFKGNSHKILLLLGDVGTGKTHMCKEAERGYGFREDPNTYENIRNCQMVKADVLYYVFLGWFHPGIDVEKGSEYNMKHLKKCKCLIIDDLGCESQKENAMATFKEGLKELLEDCVGKIVITSNMNQKLLSEKYGGKIYSRMCESSKTVVMKGKDYRRIK